MRIWSSVVKIVTFQRQLLNLRLCACEWVNMCSKGIPAGSVVGISSHSRQQFFSRYNSQGSNMLLFYLLFPFYKDFDWNFVSLFLFIANYNSSSFHFCFHFKNLKKKCLSLSHSLSQQKINVTVVTHQENVCMCVCVCVYVCVCLRER